MKKFFKNIFGYCSYCKRWLVYPKTQRRNTAFVEDKKNFLHACKSCHERDYDDYHELWKDYYTSR